MTFEDSIIYLKNKGFSAYEIHNNTDLTEAGVRKILSNKVANPQRKTKEIIIDFATKAKQNDTNCMALGAEERIKMQDLASDVIKNHHKLLQIEVYGLWFEVESQRKAIQILKE